MIKLTPLNKNKPRTLEDIFNDPFFIFLEQDPTSEEIKKYFENQDKDN